MRPGTGLVRSSDGETSHGPGSVPGLAITRHAGQPVRADRGALYARRGIDEPAWTFAWKSAPFGETWPVRMYLPDLRPSSDALAALSDLSQHAHSVDSLRAVIDGWAADHDLVVDRLDAKGNG